MPLTVGQLTAYLKLDKSEYTTGLKDAKAEAAGAGRAIADGAKKGSDGLSQASRSAADLGVALEASGRRGTASLSSLGSMARSVIPALGVGAILSKGFSRLESIDSAQAKLKGLGHDAGEVKTIMNDALASVKGTAFGLDEAASVAATAVAAGIQPGQQLESTLKLIADSAAIAGTGMGEMGSIFNKVAANGKLTTETMQQLQDQGIPVLVKLAEHYGVANEAAQKMVTEGKVSFNDFAAVMQDTLGGSALKMGDTIKGTLDNTGAALSRLGAGILGPLVPAMQSAADLVIFLSDGFGTLPAPVRDATLALGAFIALQKIGLFSGLASGAGALVTQLRLIKTEGFAASGVLATVGKAGGLAVATLGVVGLKKAWDDYHKVLADTNTLIDQTNGKLMATAKDDIAKAIAPHIDTIKSAGLTVSEVVDAIVAGGPKLHDVVVQLDNTGGVVRGILDDLGHAGTAGMWASGADHAAEEVNALGQALANSRDEQEKAARAAYELAQQNAVAAQATRDFIGPLLSEADAAAKAVAAQREHYDSLVASGAVLGSAATAMGQWIRAQQQAAAAARDTAAAIDEGNVAVNRSTVGLVGAQQDAATAMRDAELAAKKSGEAIFDSSGNFNLAQSSVRDMVTSLYSYRDAANDQITATYQQTRAQDGAVAAQQAAEAAAYAARQGFIDMATSMLGVSVPAAQAIATQLGFLQGIRIDDKTFTVTMVRRTVDVAVANSALGDSWMRRINQDAAAAAAQAQQGFTPPSLGDLIAGIPAPKTSGGGKKSGKSDAQRAAEQAAQEAKRRAEEAARAEQARQEAMARTVEGTLNQIGKAAQRPFELANMSLAGIVSQIARSERSLANALAKGLDPKAAKPLQDQLLGMAREAGKQFQAMQKQIATTDFSNLRNALSGTASDVSTAVDALIKDMRAVGASSSTIAAITAKEHQLTAAMDQRADVVKRLADAQSSLNSLLGQYDQRVAQVTSSMQSFASLTNLVSGTEMSGFGADTLLVSLQERATAAKEFTDGIAKLKRAGLNDTTLNQLIDAGPASAANQVQALLGATSAQIQQVNQLTSQVFGSGNRLGKLSADSMYGQGISAAQAMVDGLMSQKDSLTSTIEHLADGVEVLAKADMKLQGQRAMDGLIDGLKSKDSALNAAMKSIGGGMLKTFKDSLGIHSPSKVMAEQVGVPIIDGIIAGMNSKALALDSTGIRISGNLAGGSASGAQSGVIAGAQGPIDIRLTIAGDGPIMDAAIKAATVVVDGREHAAQVRVNQGGDPWPSSR